MRGVHGQVELGHAIDKGEVKCQWVLGWGFAPAVGLERDCWAQVDAYTQTCIAQPSVVDVAAVWAVSAVDVAGVKGAALAVVYSESLHTAWATPGGDSAFAVMLVAGSAAVAQPQAPASSPKCDGAGLEVPGACPRTALGASLRGGPRAGGGGEALG